MYQLVLFSSDTCYNGLYLGDKQIVSLNELHKIYSLDYLLGCNQTGLMNIAKHYVKGGQ